MPKQELLPGVSTTSCPPRVVCDAHAEIRRARRRVWIRDGVQLALLLAVDWLFVHWPDSRMPYADRHASLAFLRGANLVIISHLWLTRAMPKWSARRIATTWCRSEREKFLA
ncbi:MAG TPA: hypothetical protein VM733_14840 [Thermoanaerobaculia bacterium]|nr:hypothetical protein [Thermoanaerobaculia bacterium]